MWMNLYQDFGQATQMVQLMLPMAQLLMCLVSHWQTSQNSVGGIQGSLLWFLGLRFSFYVGKNWIPANIRYFHRGLTMFKELVDLIGHVLESRWFLEQFGGEHLGVRFIGSDVISWGNHLCEWRGWECRQVHVMYLVKNISFGCEHGVVWIFFVLEIMGKLVGGG